MPAAPAPQGAQSYWDDRARRFAAAGEGLAAVCSYGMPEFYNRAIDLTQWLALRHWLRLAAGNCVLDVGCGVGRWSRRLARRGATVTGTDHSAVMIAEARRRGGLAGPQSQCDFVVADLERLDLGRRFSWVWAVTVLQHILDEPRLSAAIGRLAHHLEPDGRLVLLEAAPDRRPARCASAVFTARTLDDYRQRLAAAGLVVETVTGVDPVPCKLWVLPLLGRLPRPVGLLLLGLATAAALPVDLPLGRALVTPSWHKVLIARHRGCHGTRSDTP